MDPQSSFRILVRAGAETKACFSECVGRSEFRKSVSSRKNCRWLEDADQLPVWIVAINSAKACSRISPTCFSAAIQDRMLCESGSSWRWHGAWKNRVADSRAQGSGTISGVDGNADIFGRPASPVRSPSSGAVPVALPPNRKVDAPSSASTSGAVPMAPPPNRKVDAAASASTSGQGMTSPTPPAASVPRGRGLQSRNSGPQRKPGEPPKQSTSAGQPEAIASPTEEPMDESGPRSDEAALLSGSESSSCAPSGPTGKQKETTKKKNAPRIKIDFKT
ncbi:hypothetical protein ISCGN_019500 [Ixodes scapularis]